MDSSSPAPDRPFDSSKPFTGLVLCCTSIEADLRSEIAKRTVELGGIHKYDLTPNVTHLIVGDYDTAKYRHVARERPDIKPMAAGWVDAVRDLWTEDKDFDFTALEEEWKLKTFETGGGIPKSAIPEQRERTRLICCLTGFEDNDTRILIEKTVRKNGGDYIGDLSRRVTHLIVCKPEGKKYVAARKWGIRTVSIEWLNDSVERGMILNEECYDPTLPAHERGKGAWIRRELERGASLGKRMHDDATAPPADEGRRKLRKTASMKLISQRDNLWGDILVGQSSTDLSKSVTAIPNERPASVPPILAADLAASTAEDRLLVNVIQPLDGGVFSSCRFYIHGFSMNKQQIVRHHILSHDGQVSESIEDAASSHHSEPPDRRYVMVPQNSQPETHPQVPEGMHIVTEFYIERCVHNKMLFNPREQVLGQPFPRFPIRGFGDLTICTSGFRNEQLNQVEKAITQLGAKYSERLNAQCSILVCPSLDGVRKQKLDFAVFSRIPVVDADWLWQCITTGCLVPWEKFLFPALAQKAPMKRDTSAGVAKGNIPGSKSNIRSRSESESNNPTSAIRHNIDGDIPTPREAIDEEQQTDEPEFETAPTNQTKHVDSESKHVTAPLSETTSNGLNKSPSPQKTPPQPRKLKRFPTGGEVGDSESGDDSDPSATRSRDAAKVEEEERKRQAEREKAAEREEMSKRLNSLMARDGAAQDCDGIKPQPASRQQRRRREILGRAASNVSTASSASAESLTNTSNSKSNFRRTESSASRLDSMQGTSTTFSFLDKMIMQQSGNSDQGTEDGDSQPRGTQLEYDNPEARQHRAAVVGRMMADSKQSDVSSKGQSQGQDVQIPINLDDNTPKASGRRTTRRR
ncbi:uncharacterized protein F4812DRAFT_133481 [Daldinia caldariorum]|uniref:uncharacterized protein n=1 Tax=Daldinia caldariorum TaxID=326644 RepID=UPI002008197D|nr:uncharacterized protein F4812DRAFT_133481 [Daldinia caldariorum]KAI1465133.1 hypothetical protein F4812DRAFT_133481 [Daldinia caldariorum]